MNTPVYLTPLEHSSTLSLCSPHAHVIMYIS